MGVSEGRVKLICSRAKEFICLEKVKKCMVINGENAIGFTTKGGGDGLEFGR